MIYIISSSMHEALNRGKNDRVKFIGKNQCEFE